MNDTSRRKFLAATGAGVAGAAVVGVGGAADAVTPRRRDAATEPVVAYVPDHTSGVVHLMVGDREVIVDDRDLVARILNAAAERQAGRPARRQEGR